MFHRLFKFVKISGNTIEKAHIYQQFHKIEKMLFVQVRGAKQFEKLIEEKDFVAVFW